jgi:outer membrane protein OmpA-like peptidoglycan-associated protein/tetratricopeptide (TPR) repeat protein
MKFKHLFLTFLVVAATAMGMEAQSTAMTTAKKFYDKFDYTTAARIYKRVLKKAPTNSSAVEQLAKCYMALNKSDQSEIWLGQLANSASADPIYKFYYAQALRNNGKYDEAKAFYAEYAKIAKDDSRSQEILKGIEMIAMLSKDNPSYQVQLLNCNSTASDFGPSIYKDKLYFASNREKDIIVRRTDRWTKMPFLQIYTAEIDQNTNNANKASLMRGKEPNGRFHEGPVCVDPITNEMYVTRSNYLNKPIKADDKAVKLKIYKMEYNATNSKWDSKLISDFPQNNTQYSCAHPTISKDGQDLYYSSDAPLGKGLSDIYVCHKQGNTWGAPENLPINTPGREMFPFIADDGTLYFASDGHFGLGGLDIYAVKKDANGKWGRIANMGAPLNSQYDDFAYTQNSDGSKGFFTSNRTGGVGDDDIYSFTKEGVRLCGEVVDAKTLAKLPGALVKIYNGNLLKATLTADKNGAFCYDAEPNTTYKLATTKVGYLTNEMKVDVKTTPKTVTIPLDRNGYLLDVLVIETEDKTPNKKPLADENVTLINLQTLKEAAKVTGSDGYCYYDLEPNTDYKIVVADRIVSADCRYLANSALISTKGVAAPAELKVTIEVELKCRYVPIIIKNIYYDLDKYYIRPDAEKELDHIVKVLQDNPTMEIELSSHTDCRASFQYNMWLSAKRAEAAVNYLIKRGINPARMVVAGYGETRLINRCECEGDRVVPCTEEEHQENRRTEFKILQF